MVILKRLAVWFLETSTEIVLMAVLLTFLFGFDQHALIRDSLIYSFDVTVLSFTTGYLATTLVARALWRGKLIWWYPVIASTLFLIHFEIMNRSFGWVFESRDMQVIRAVGVCIAFACTFAGTFVLRRWSAVASERLRSAV